MPEIDVTDEGFIRAERDVVFDAIIGLMAGNAGWWRPHLRVSCLGEARPGQVGSLTEIRVPRRARFIARIEEAIAPSRLRVAYISGDFSGVGLWTFDRDVGGTRLRFRWQVVPTRWWMRAVTSIVERNHSRVMQLGFRALDAHLQRA